MLSPRHALFPVFAGDRKQEQENVGFRSGVIPDGKVLESFLKAISKNSHLKVELGNPQPTRVGQV